MSWINYLLEANLYLVLFYAAYYLLLRKDTHYQFNRICLLTSSLLSFIIPLVQIGILKPAPLALPLNGAVNMSFTMPSTQQVSVNMTAPVVTINYYLLVYLAIVLILTIAFAFRLYQLIKLARKGKRIAASNFNLVELDDDNHAFSFFNYLFIGKTLSSSATVIQHELVHIRQKHSFDIIYLEFLKIICWFNPAVYLLQNSLKEVHEFIADNHIAHDQQAVNDYTDFLISNAYGLPDSALTNNFFNKNLLKTRIMMLHQKRSGSLARLKYLVALPLLAGMLCLSTLGFTKDYTMVDLAPAQQTVDRQIPPPPPPAPPVQKRSSKDVPPPPPPPAPVFLTPAYNGLGNYMQAQLQYPTTAYNKKVVGTVVLDFKLDNAGKIQDIKVAKSVGSGLDEEAIRLMKKYKAPIKDKAGNHSIGINFNIKGNNFTEVASPEMKKKPGFVGEFFLPGSPLGKQNIKFPPPIVRPDTKPVKGPNVDLQSDAPAEEPAAKTDTIAKNPFDSFYKYVGQHVRYPTAARDNNIQGRVFVIFNINDDRSITNVFVARGLTDDMNNEVVRVIKSYQANPAFKTDVNYTIPLSFTIQGQDKDSYVTRKDYSPVPDKPKTNEIYKKTGFKTRALNEVVVVSYASAKK